MTTVLQQETQDSVPILTPALRLIVLLHHEWNHVQLLLVGVVGLQPALPVSHPRVV